MYCNVWLCNVQPSGSFGQIKAIYRQIWRKTSLGGVGSHLPVLTVIKSMNTLIFYTSGWLFTEQGPASETYICYLK
jgi:hypothetical protein